MYELCRQNTQFETLNGAFLVHRGIATMSAEQWFSLRPTVSYNHMLFLQFRRLLDTKYPQQDIIGTVTVCNNTHCRACAEYCDAAHAPRVTSSVTQLNV